MLESAGFEKSQIFVAIEPDDLVQYEENERIVPVESRIPQANMLLVEEPKSSADTLAEVPYSLQNLGSIRTDRSADLAIPGSLFATFTCFVIRK